MYHAESEPNALPELHISGIMRVSLENALSRSSLQASDRASVDGLAFDDTATLAVKRLGT